MNAETRQELFEYLSGELGVLALESNLDDIERIINPKVYPYYLTDDSEENILSNIKKSTENLSKIEDKDKWLDEVKGNKEESKNKYSWFANHEEELPFSVIYTENDIETPIAVTDSAEKADFISKACNQYNFIMNVMEHLSDFNS